MSESVGAQRAALIKELEALGYSPEDARLAAAHYLDVVDDSPAAPEQIAGEAKPTSTDTDRS